MGPGVIAASVAGAEAIAIDQTSPRIDHLARMSGYYTSLRTTLKLPFRSAFMAEKNVGALLLSLSLVLFGIDCRFVPDSTAMSDEAGTASSSQSRFDEPQPVATSASVEAADEAPKQSAGDGAIVELERQVIAVYEKAGPGVVNITTRSLTYDFFLNAVPQEGSGSGFVFDDQGHIVTNYHVIEGASELQVTFFDDTRESATLVGVDPSNDLAVIKVEVSEVLKPLPLGDSDALRVGRFVVAIGNPFGLEQTLTTGTVSSLGRVIQSPDGRFIGEIIQTDAAINPGNSGGPLLDLAGRAVGVNSAIISPSRASAGIGFAIPSSTVRRVVPELIRRGRYAHPWLGVQPMAISSKTAALLNRNGVRTPGGGGLLVGRVVRRGPAESVGIRGPQRVGRIGNLRVPLDADYILAIDGESLTNERELTVLLETKYRVGDEVAVTVWRDGEILEVPLVLGERPE